MRIQDLTEKYEKTFCVCFEDGSDEMNDAGDHKCIWLQKMRARGLGAKIALDDAGTAIGMIQYLPIEYSCAEGDNLYFIDCIWVHGYDHGIGNFQGQGIGEQLLHAAEEDARAKGAKGMAAWGLGIPVWMKASYYKHRGYKKVDRIGIRTLLWKPFTEDARPPKWTQQVKSPKPKANPGKVTLMAFYDGRCPTQGITLERAKRAANDFGDDVVLEIVNTFDRDVYKEWGISDGLFLEGKNIIKGPPLTYDDIHREIAKKVKKLKK